MRRVIEPTKVLNAECRRRGLPIVWTRHGTRGIGDGGPFMAKRVLLREGGLRIGTWGYEILDELGRPPGGLAGREDPPVGVLPDQSGADPARARRRDGDPHRGAHEPVRRSDVQGRALPRLQADRGRGVRRHGDAPSPRSRDRDDPRRLGTGEHARADARGAPRLPGSPATREEGTVGTIGSQFLAQDFEECVASVQKAEEAGYSHAWFVDSQLLWQDCFVYMTHALAADRAHRRRHGRDEPVHAPRDDAPRASSRPSPGSTRGASRSASGGATARCGRWA